MVKKGYYLIILFLFCFASFGVASTKDAIIIDDFEGDGTSLLSHEKYSKKWCFFSGGRSKGVARISSEVKKNGKASLEISFPKGQGGWIQRHKLHSPRIFLSKNSGIELWIKGKTSGEISIKFLIRNSKENHSIRVPFTTTWKKVEVLFSKFSKNGGEMIEGELGAIIITSVQRKSAHFYIDDLCLIPKKKSKNTESATLGKTSLNIHSVIFSNKANKTIPAFFPKIKDGVFMRNGKPVFLLLAEIHQLMYSKLAKMLGFDLVVLDHTGRDRYTIKIKKSKKQIDVSWGRYPWHSTLIKDILHYGLLPWIEFTEAGGANEMKRAILYKERPDLFLDHGHFISYSTENHIGNTLRKNGRKSILDTIRKHPIFMYETFNELYYRSHSEELLKAFQTAMRKKYGNIDSANKLWGSSYKSFDDVVPPNPGNSKAFQFNIPAEKRLLWYDWMKHQEIHSADFIADINAFHKACHTSVNTGEAPFVGTQALYDLNRDYHNSGIYPPSLANSQDIYLCEIHSILYYQSALEDSLEMIAMLKDTMIYDVIRNAAGKKPIINSEVTMGGRGSASPWVPLISLHCPWKFSPVKNVKGTPAAENFDDKTWKQIPVPAGWGLHGYSNTTEAWYRKKVPLSNLKKIIKQMGSVVLRGSELADKAEIYVNGKLVHKTKIYNESFAIPLDKEMLDKDTLLIAIKIKNTYYKGGMYWGGIRGYITLDAKRDIPRKGFTKEQLRFSLWRALLHGHDGTAISYFWADEANHKLASPFDPRRWERETLREIPTAKAEIELLGSFAIPKPRRNSKIAFLFSYPTLRSRIPKNYNEMNASPMSKYLARYYGASLSLGVGIDVVNDDDIIAGKLKNYPLAIIAGARNIKPESFKKLKEYVAGGGVVICDFDSLYINDRFQTKLKGDDEFIGLKRIEFVKDKGDKIEPRRADDLTGVKFNIDKAKNFLSDVKGLTVVSENLIKKGKVFFISKAFSMNYLSRIFNKIFSKINIKADVKISSQGKKILYIENYPFKNGDKSLIVFMNYGTDADLTVSIKKSILPSGCDSVINLHTGKNYKLKHDSEFSIINSIKIPCQTPVLLFAGDEQKYLQALKEIKLKNSTLNKLWQDIPGTKGRILVFDDYHNPSRDKIPTAVAELQKDGYQVDGLLDAGDGSGKKITVYSPKGTIQTNLDSYHALFVMGPRKISISVNALKKYVQDGGALFASGLAFKGPHGWYSNNRVNKIIEPFGVKLKYNSFNNLVRFKENLNGIPFWGKGSKSKITHPATINISKIQLKGACKFQQLAYKVNVLIEEPSTAEPLIIAGEYMKGRFVVSSDAFWLTPGVFDKADNKKFLINIANWLVDEDQKREMKIIKVINLKKSLDIKDAEQEEKRRIDVGRQQK